MTEPKESVESPSSRDAELHALAEQIVDTTYEIPTDGEVEALAEWALRLEQERNSLCWQITTFERETAKRIETLKEAEAVVKSWRGWAHLVWTEGPYRPELTDAERQTGICNQFDRLNADLADARKEALISRNDRRLAENDLKALRDGLATLPGCDVSELDDMLLPEEKPNGRWIDRADVAALLKDQP